MLALPLSTLQLMEAEAVPEIDPEEADEVKPEEDYVLVVEEERDAPVAVIEAQVLGKAFLEAFLEELPMDEAVRNAARH